MKIGIIVYSQTGNTYSVALKLKEKLTTGSHSVEVERLDADSLQIPLNVGKYDALVLGSPVEGFSLSKTMENYLLQIESFQGKKVALFVTEFFPYPWMGGNQAIKKMKKICESREGAVCGTGVVNWKSKNREKMIVDTVDRLSSLF